MAPGTGTIEVGGFTGYETMTLVQGLKDVNIVAMDMVEVLPAIDQSGKTAYMAANIIHEVISILALQKRDGKR
jgi:agmatinase